ncbi:hypothetical protein [Nocardia sp. XZ_19_385]|nr:hypothetical protein [Nocardia sp. XZ_19_385]
MTDLIQADPWAGGALTAVVCNPAFWMSMFAVVALILLLFRD